MASSIINLPQGVWVQITTADKDGSVKHRAGDTKIAYLEAPVIPVGYVPETPTMEETVQGDTWPYWGVDAADFVWAYAINEDAVIVVSPKGAA